MPLSRGEGSIRVVDDGCPSPLSGAQSIVIAIAATVEERLRLAELINGHAAVLLVSNPAEAIEFLVATSLPEAAPRPVAVPALATPSPHGLEVDSDWRVAIWRGREVALSPLEHDLLRFLLENVGHVQTFEALQLGVWGNNHLGGRANVQSVVKRLRRKLRDLESPLQIDGVRGVGLRLVEVRQI